MQLRSQIMLILIILCSLYDKLAPLLYVKYNNLFDSILGPYSAIGVIILSRLPIVTLLIILFLKVLKEQKKSIMLIWCTFAIIDYSLAIPVFIMFSMIDSKLGYVPPSMQKLDSQN
tara:strand:+ start:306 stop:653 length:348 start_codon:yes stop_codon:yes gene_type:complete